MAIAFDTASIFQSAVAASLTYSFTTSGANRALVVGAVTVAGTVTSITYNGVAMTLPTSGHVALSGDAAGWDHAYFYYLLNPIVGANNVIITTAGGTSIGSFAASYTGVHQTGGFDSSNSTGPTAGITTISPSTTTVASSTWTIGWFRNDQANFAAGAGTTFRTAGSIGIADSSADLTPGINTLTGTWVGAGNAAAIIISLAPVSNSGSMFGIF